MQLDVGRKDFARYEVFGRAGGIAMRAIEGRRGHLCDLAIGRDIREAHNPVGPFCTG